MEYIALVCSFLLVSLEAIVRICTLALRKPWPNEQRYFARLTGHSFVSRFLPLPRFAPHIPPLLIPC